MGLPSTPEAPWHCVLVTLVNSGLSIRPDTWQFLNQCFLNEWPGFLIIALDCTFEFSFQPYFLPHGWNLLLKPWPGLPLGAHRSCRAFRPRQCDRLLLPPGHSQPCATQQLFLYPKWEINVSLDTKGLGRRTQKNQSKSMSTICNTILSSLSDLPKTTYTAAHLPSDRHCAMLYTRPFI